MKCPICNSPKLPLYAETPSGLRFYLCPECVLLVQDNYQNMENSPEYGKEKYSSHSDIHFLKHYIGSGKITSRFKRAAYNAAFLTESLKNAHDSYYDILDIGGGTGENLYCLKHSASLKVQQAALVERSTIDRKIAENLYELEAYENTDLLPNQTFDLITLHHVLEHIPDPHTFITSLLSHLKDSGYLFLSLPDCFTRINRWRKNKCTWLISDHLVLYSPKAVEKLLASYGFKLIRERRHFLESPLVSYKFKLLLAGWRKGNLLPPRFEDGFVQLYQKMDGTREL